MTTSAPILCVTPNPAVDHTLIVPDFRPGDIFRSFRYWKAAGGKGINVARAVQKLGGQAVCAGFLGGRAGREILELAEDEGLPGAWTTIEAETRTCVIIADPKAGHSTVINEDGPTVTADDWLRLHQDILRESANYAAVTFSGSLPPGALPEHYADLIRALHHAGKPVWVDTSGAALRTVLSVPSTGIKVNGSEAGEILGRTIDDVESALAAAVELQSIQTETAVLTLGAKGAVMSHAAGRWWAQPPDLTITNAVGSGDSFLAGLVLGFITGRSPGEALQWAVAAGTANAAARGGGHFTREDFDRVLAQTALRAF